MRKEKVKKKLAIYELPLCDRPREKAKRLGLAGLSNSELLALIIGSGQAGHNALDLASKVEALLRKYELSAKNLSKIYGIGTILADKILASLELGQRLAEKDQSRQIDNPSKVSTLALDLASKKQEHCLAFYLNGRQELLSRKTIAIGGLNYNFLEARDIFEPAFQLGASSLILLHNHPSGNCEPSEDDLLLTEKIAKIAKLLGVKLLDHIIIGKNNYFSIKEHFGELLKV